MQKNIIQLLKAQDPAAIAELYDNYSSSLYGIVLRIVPSRALAQQVMQESFLNAWRQSAQFDESTHNLFPWLVDITRKTALHFTRNDDHTGIVNSGPETPAQAEPHRRMRFEEKLDVKCKTLIDLIYFKGYSPTEITAATGLPVSLIKSRLRCAMLELRKKHNYNRT